MTAGLCSLYCCSEAGGHPTLPGGAITGAGCENTPCHVISSQNSVVKGKKGATRGAGMCARSFVAASKDVK